MDSPAQPTSAKPNASVHEVKDHTEYPLSLDGRIESSTPDTHQTTSHFPEDQANGELFAGLSPLHASPPSTLDLSSSLSSRKTSSSSIHGQHYLRRQSSSHSLDRIPTGQSATSISHRSQFPHARSHSSSKTSSLAARYPNHPSYFPHSSSTQPYPSQAYSNLDIPLKLKRPAPTRTQSSHQPHVTYLNPTSVPQEPTQRSASGNRATTAGYTPTTTLGLFSPPSARLPTYTGPRSRSQTNSPQLHPMHLMAPVETDKVAKDIDVYTGRKVINQYQISEEIGRGEFGKVKLALDLRTGISVAIKIVPRYSKRRRLGRLSEPDERVKREVAILKKARHQNVVSLLEVIDDPEFKKLYLVLEYIANGEIQWRKEGVREILSCNLVRTEQFRLGLPVSLEPEDGEKMALTRAKRVKMAIEMRAQAAQTRSDPWSLEHGGDEDADVEVLESNSTLSRNQSRQTIASNPSRVDSLEDFANSPDGPLSGSMYGAYASDMMRDRRFSVAYSTASHMSSEFNPFESDEYDDQAAYVPALTYDEARQAFRDTLLGLEYLHYVGIIHRDIKPANLLVTAEHYVKISDFGVSYLGRPTSDEDPDNKTSPADASTLDDPRELARSVGTPAFWAPELCYEDPRQLGSETPPEITSALDLWSLGITLYCIVYARVPFHADQDMGLHEAICSKEVFLPPFRLVPADTTLGRKPTALVSKYHPLSPNKRRDYDLKFEAVPESVRDLIRRLLIKNPGKRMTIQEAKKHPWVMEGIVDSEKWIVKTKPENEGRPSQIPVDSKEVSSAVGRFTAGIGAGLGKLGKTVKGLLPGGNRSRTSSNAASTSASSDSIASTSASSGSTLGKAASVRDARRTSVNPDEIIAALKSSRDGGGHPLSQSQSASPDNHPSSPILGASDEALPSEQSDGGATPEPVARPRGPERAVSTAASIQTITAAQPTVQSSRPEPLFLENETTDLLESTPFSIAHIGGMLSGASKKLASFRSRERRANGVSRSPSTERCHSAMDTHSTPSLAVSTAMAAGGVEQPGELSQGQGMRRPASSEAFSTSPVRGRHKSMIPAPASTPTAFESARELNYRRRIQESQAEEAHIKARAIQISMRPQTAPDAFDCPPSPDDELHLKKLQAASQQTSPQQPVPNLPSSSTTASSSADNFRFDSGAQSAANNSMTIISNASSPPTEGYMAPTSKASSLDESEDLKTPPAMRSMETTSTQSSVKTTLEVASDLGLEHDNDREGSGVADDGDDDENNNNDEDDDEDDGLVMMGNSKSIVNRS